MWHLLRSNTVNFFTTTFLPQLSHCLSFSNYFHEVVVDVRRSGKIAANIRELVNGLECLVFDSDSWYHLRLLRGRLVKNLSSFGTNC